MICRDPKFIFVHIPKAAGTSLIRGLRSIYGQAVVTNDRDPELCRFISANWDGDWPNHAPLRVIKGYLGTDFESFFRFAFVRNPWERVVSNYHYNRKIGTADYDQIGKEVPKWRRDILGLDFADWVATGAIGRAQTDKITENGRLLTSFVGKTERLQEDFNIVCEQLGAKPVDLGHANASSHLDYRQHYNTASREMVARRYASDIELFEYSF